MTSQLGVAVPIWVGHGRAPRFSKPRPPFSLVTPRRVHGLEMEGRDCGEAAAQWVTSFLKSQPYRLVHFEPHMQPRKPHQIHAVFQPKDQVRGGPLGLGRGGVLWEAGFLGSGAPSTSSPSGRSAFLLSSGLVVPGGPQAITIGKNQALPSGTSSVLLDLGVTPALLPMDIYLPIGANVMPLGFQKCSVPVSFPLHSVIARGVQSFYSLNAVKTMSVGWRPTALK